MTFQQQVISILTEMNGRIKNLEKKQVRGRINPVVDDEKEVWIGVKEAIAISKYSDEWLRQMRKAGKLKYKRAKHGNKILYLQSEIQNLFTAWRGAHEQF